MPDAPLLQSPAIERAARRDATGDHDEAINELARGTAAGDTACTRALGLRLLIGDRAPLLRQEGLRFLGEACDRGVPEAAARAAGILALGVHAPPDWTQALAWLYRSAARGWEPAQRQLLALCDDRALAAREASRAQPDYRAVAAAVRLEDWRRSPAPVVHCDEPRIATFEGFVRREICDVLIGFASGRLEPARVYDPSINEDVVNAHRTNTLAVFNIDTVEMVHSLLQARMASACGVHERFMEAPNVLHYFPGEQIRDHYDFVDPKAYPQYDEEIARTGQRIITFLVYLNDAYEGGETDFPKLGVTHRGRLGEGIYFVNALPDLSPDLRMLHAGRPPTRGEKWIVTQFVRSRPLR